MPEKCEDLEELRWSPGIPDCDLMTYLRGVRGMAAFAGICNGGSTEDGCVAASRDDITINATYLLHQSSYNTGKALQTFVNPPGIEKKWLEDEQKRFVDGLQQYGKNFFKIRKELLPHKEIADLVEFYYLWKKSPGGVASRTHRQNWRQSTLRRIKPSPEKQNRSNSNDYMDASCGSDEGTDSENSDSRDVTGYTCQNCYTTTSKDWLPVGRDLAVMCTECRFYYKKHGELRPVDSKDNLPFLFQPVKKENGVNEKHVMRTRRSKERLNPKTLAKENNATSKAGRKRLGAATNCSTGSLDRDRKKKPNQDSVQKGKRKIKEDNAEEKNRNQKKKRSYSPSEKALAPFPHMPLQPIKHKYNSAPSDSPNKSRTPPPTSSPYNSAPPALPQPNQESPLSPKSHSYSESESTSTFPRSTQSSLNSIQSPLVTSHSSIPHQPSTYSSSKSPSLYSLQNLNSQNSSQKVVPQPAHQSSLYTQLGMNQPSSIKSSNHPHQLARPHPLSQLHPSSGTKKGEKVEDNEAEKSGNQKKKRSDSPSESVCTESSVFNYRPFSPQYPYTPALPPFPHVPPQPINHKYNSAPSDSPSNSRTPPPTSSPYNSEPPALINPYLESPSPPIEMPVLVKEELFTPVPQESPICPVELKQEIIN